MDAKWLADCKQIARRDDCMLFLVPSDIRQLIAKIERLEAKVEEQRCLLERACDLGERAIAAAKEQA